MPLTTAEREERLAKAIQYFHEHNGEIPVRTVARKYLVHHVTLGKRLQNKTHSLQQNGGQNKLLNSIQVYAVIIYIRKQALSGFPCTSYIIAGAVAWIRAQDGLPPPSIA